MPADIFKKGCLIMILNVIGCAFEDFKYEVIAPEYICSKENQSQTTIRLTGEDLPKLILNWSVNFLQDESSSLEQRHVLMVWRSVRYLEQIFQKTSASDNASDLIFINNTMLTPDVTYLINITAQKKDNKIMVDQKHVAIKYMSEDNSQSEMSVQLIGPEVTYSDMLYVAETEINSCSENSEYQLFWQLLDGSKKILREESTKSRQFQLPAGSLTSGKAYSIKCLVLDNKSNQNKSSTELQVNVLERGMQLNTFTAYLKIGVNQPIYLNGFFSDPDGIDGDLTFTWKCRNSNNENCAGFESINTTELVLKKGFPNTGRYVLTLEAKKRQKVVNAKCVLEVTEEILPVIDIEDATTVCNPTDMLRISAHVSQLFPGCIIQWTSVVDNRTGYKHIDLNNVPGFPGKPYTISKDEEGHQELSEYNDNEDDTIEKQYNLIIPSCSDGSWSGPQSNAKYLFRLTTTCPCNEVNNSSKEKVEETRMTSSADVVITINSVPLLKPLQVVPESGQALRTIFSFSTGKPENSAQPLSYNFGYINHKKNEFIIKQCDITSALTILPFHEEPIQTLLQVCDSNNACNFTLGPKVIVKLPSNFTTAEINSLSRDFSKSMSEQNYFKALTLASILLQTTKKMESKVPFNNYDGLVKNATKNELQSFLKAEDESWIQPATNLLKQIKILDDAITLPEDILNDMLALRDKISEKQQSTSRKKQSQSEKLQSFPSRKLLSVRSKKSKRIVNDINIDEIKDYLEISELAIKRFTDFERVESEKQKLRKKLEYYIPRICQFLYNNYKTNVQIELSTLLLDVEKINLVRKYTDFISVPYEMNLAARLQVGRTLAERYRNRNGLCIGKILFVEDYFHIPQYVFHAKLYSALSDDYLNTETEKFTVTIDMPIKSTVSNNQMFQCVIWEENEWVFSKCRTLEETDERVKCKCSSMGYFSMVAAQRTVTTTSSTLKTSVSPMTQATESYVSTIIHSLMTTPNLHYHVTPLQPITSVLLTTTTEQSENYRNYQTNSIYDSGVKSAAVWSITLLSVGIFTVLLAFLVLYRRFKRSKGIQSFQTIEYAKFFDDHNLE